MEADWWHSNNQLLCITNLKSHTENNHVAHWARYNSTPNADKLTKMNTLDKYNFAASKDDLVHLSLMHMIISSHLPFTYVGDESTQAHFTQVAPDFAINSETWYRKVQISNIWQLKFTSFSLLQELLPRVYASLCADISTELGKASVDGHTLLSCTSDGWTTPHCHSTPRPPHHCRVSDSFHTQVSSLEVG
jgi:hypothetical protein